MDRWLQVPSEIWDIIFESLRVDLYDIIQFMACCSHFRLIGYRLSSPFLLIPRSSFFESHDLFSLSDDKRTYPIVSPGLHDRFCLGSSYGWLVTLDFISGEICLLNPINQAMISLPPLSSFDDPRLTTLRTKQDWHRYYFKATISADPIKDNSFVVLFRSRNVLSFCRPGDIQWTTLIIPVGKIEDAIGHMGKFYAIFSCGKIVCWDRCATNTSFKTIIKSRRKSDQRFLVNSPGGELLVVNYKESHGKYSVLKLDKDRNILIKLEGLDGDEALFLSRHNSICVSTLGYSQYLPNRIYLTNWVEKSVCEYNLEDGSTKHIYTFCTSSISTSTRDAVWVTPTRKKSPRIITKTKRTTTSDPPNMAVTNSNVKRGRKS